MPERAAPRTGYPEGMHAEAEPGSAEREAHDACRRAVERLRAADVRTEALAEFVPSERKLLWRKAATMREQGEVWRIGPLLLDTDGRLYVAGRATRAAERPRPSYQSESREERRDIAAAALKGGFPEGTAVDFDAVPIPLDGSPMPPDSPVVRTADAYRVRWHPTAPIATAPTLAVFLEDRVGLLVDPPLRST